jgi:hypothetical protein
METKQTCMYSQIGVRAQNIDTSRGSVTNTIGRANLKTFDFQLSILELKMAIYAIHSCKSNKTIQFDPTPINVCKIENGHNGVTYPIQYSLLIYPLSHLSSFNVGPKLLRVVTLIPNL